MTDQYIWHLTLDTGHTRQSWRREIDPALLPQLALLLDAALKNADSEDTPGVPLPVPGYSLIAEGDGRCLLAAVVADDQTPLITFGVAGHARCGAGLWRILTEIPAPIHPTAQRPQAPWCAVKIMPGLVIYPSAADWLGDFERCIAWAWIDRLERK